MAGALTISTLNNDTGVLATQNGMTGIAKAWVNFNGGTAVINNSFNVSSVTRTAQGAYTINFTTAMPNANYSVAGNCGNILSGGGTLSPLLMINNNGVTPTTSAFGINVVQATNSVLYDPTLVNVAVFSS